MDSSAITNELTRVQDFLSHKPEINTVYLYGSFAKGNALASSDIDLAIFLDPAFESHSSYYGELMAQIEALSLPRKIDIFVVNNMSPLFRFNVIYPNKVLYCKDDSKRVGFELKTRRDYEDYLPFFKYRTENAVKEARRRLNEGTKPGQRKN